MTEPLISVGIFTKPKISFTFFGEFRVNNSENIYSGIYNVSLDGSRIIIEQNGNSYAFENEVIFEPQDLDSEYFSLKDVVIGVDFHWQRTEKESFRGSLKLMIDDNGILAINIIPVEEYLKSVISSEMSAKSRLHLLKAHAIISRSWLLAQIEKSDQLKRQQKKYVTRTLAANELTVWYDREDHEKFDVCADDHCQRYQGITKIYTEIANRAVEETKGLLLTHENKICDARFSKSCGGISESFENVWEPIRFPYLQAVIDYKFEPDNFETDFSNEANAEKWIRANPAAYCNTKDTKVLSQILLDYDLETSDFYRWKVVYSQDEISQLIKKKSEIDFGDIVDLIPVERGHSARLIKLKIVGTKKTMTIGKELEIRRTLSKTHLYSSAFIVEKKNIVDGTPQQFILRGAGWGHGVGLCQIGAAVMAEKGFQFDEILMHYYRSARIEKRY